MTIVLFFTVAVIGYLLGSIPFGLLVGKRAAGTDVRKVGSGNTGMTNVMRAAGKKAAALVLVLDVAKGFLAVIIAGLIFRDSYHYIAQVVAALAAVSGHNWSIFLKFRGGRGVSTFTGALLAMHWPAAVVAGGLMLIIGFRTKYMSLGSITGAVVGFIMLLVLNIFTLDFLRPYPPFEYVIYAMLGSIFIYIMHRENIMRLLSGTEHRIDEKVGAGNLPSPDSRR